MKDFEKMTVIEMEKYFQDKFSWERPELDVRLSALHKTPVYSIYAFDDHLHDVFGDYENDTGLSMREFIEAQYGEEGLEFCLVAFGMK